MSDMPLASVVIDNYNYERFLADAIDSALAQTYTRTEVIVVDDGSTDGSRRLIAKYAEEGRVLPVLKPNGGQGSALNVGFAASHGDVVLFLDSDDLLRTTAVDYAVRALGGPGGWIKVQWPMDAVDEFGRLLGRSVPGRLPDDGDLRAKVSLRGPGSVVSSPTSGNAWRRDFLAAVMPIPEDIPYYMRCADEYLFMLAAATGPVRTIVDRLGSYRIHAGSTYSGRPFDEKLQLELDGYEAQCRSLSRVLESQGVAFDASVWRTGSWWHQLHRAVRALRAAVPTGERVVLIDDGTWGMSADDNPIVLALNERHGVDWGPPATDAEAIAAVESHRAAGVRFLAVAWPAFWWLEHYTGLAAHLRSRSAPLIDTPDLALFDLERRAR